MSDGTFNFETYELQLRYNNIYSITEQFNGRVFYYYAPDKDKAIKLYEDLYGGKEKVKIEHCESDVLDKRFFKDEDGYQVSLRDLLDDDEYDITEARLLAESSI